MAHSGSLSGPHAESFTARPPEQLLETVSPYVVPFASVRWHDVERVGGKNASLGEMLGALGALGVRVPDGFATTAQA